MKDYKLSEVRDICKSRVICAGCEFSTEEGKYCFIDKGDPSDWLFEKQDKNEFIKTEGYMLKGWHGLELVERGEEDTTTGGGVPMNELKDTVELMISPDYKDRFKAEYYQLKIRFEKLNDLLNRIEASCLSDSVEEPKHDCPERTLREQFISMHDYLNTLEVRAIIEGIDLK